MKKSMFIPAAILLVAACNQTQIETIGSHEGLVPFTINDAAFPVATPEDEGSKTALADLSGSAVNWTAGDNAAVFDNAGAAGHLFTGSVLSDATRISLTGEVNDKATAYWALYPYNSGASLSGGVLSTTLSASQSAVAGSFADKTAISLAKGTRTPGQESADGLEFENLCTLISFNMPSYVEGAQSVTITANSGTDLAGSISFNAADGSLNSVSGSSSVTLNGPLAAGAKYFAVIAPKEYAGGFTFTVTAAGGATYSASSSKTVPGAQGAIYHIGTLGLKLDVTPTVTIAHTYSSGTLTGSTATLSIPVADELAGMIDSWTATLKNSDNVTVRNYTSNSGTGSVAGGYVYLPKGNYTLSATYTTKDGRSKTLAPVTVNHNVNPAFSVSVSGYTSYNYGVGADGYTKNVSTANGLDGSSIYGLGTSVTIAADLMNDSKYSKSYSYSYDGGAAVSVSGNSASIASKSGQSWAKHTLSASCTFDGVINNASRDLHVTGLPFYCPVPTSTMWDTKDNGTGEVRFDNDGVYMRSTGLNAFATTKTGFYCPEGIGGKISADMRLYAKSSLAQIQITVSLGSITCARQDSEASLIKAKTVYKSTSKTGTINNGDKIQIKAYAGATGPNATIYNINAVYN